MQGQVGKGRLIIILVAILGLLGGAGGGYWLLGGHGGRSARAATEEQGPIFTLEQIVTNLNEPGRRAYIQVQLAMEVKDRRVYKELEARGAQARNEVLGLLRARTMEQVQGDKGMQQLADTIRIRLNRLMPDGGVNRVYFTEFVVQ